MPFDDAGLCLVGFVPAKLELKSSLIEPSPDESLCLERVYMPGNARLGTYSHMPRDHLVRRKVSVVLDVPRDDLENISLSTCSGLH